MAPITLKTNAQGFVRVSPTSWTARTTWEIGSAVYTVLQDTGASPKVRVYKWDSNTAPTGMTEQDAANNKTGVQNLSFDSWYDGTHLHVICHTATNTVVHHRFNPSTDLWTTGFGTVSTAMMGLNPIRGTTMSDGFVVVAGTNSADDIDLRYAYSNGGAWTTALFLSLSSTARSKIWDMPGIGMGFANFIYGDGLNNDMSWRTLSTAKALGTETDIFGTHIALAGQDPSGFRANVYDIAGTKYAQFFEYELSSDFLHARRVTLGGASGAGSLQAETFAAESGVIPQGGLSSWADPAGDLYLVYNNGTGTNIRYSKFTGGAWQAGVAWGTGYGTIIDAAPVGIGLAVIYQSGSDVLMDALVPFVTPPLVILGEVATGSAAHLVPGAKLTVPGALATGSAAHMVPNPTLRIASVVAAATGGMLTPNTGARQIAGVLATAAATHLVPNPKLITPAARGLASALELAPGLRLLVSGALATAAGTGLAPSVRLSMPGAVGLATAAMLAPGTGIPAIQAALAQASAAALAPAMRLVMAGQLGLASGAALAATVRATVQGALAAGSGAALVPSTQLLVAGALSTASGQMYEPTTTQPPVIILGELATAMALMLAPTLPVQPFVPPVAVATGAMQAPAMRLSVSGALATAAAAALSPAVRILVASAILQASAAMLAPNTGAGAILAALATASGLVLPPSAIIRAGVPVSAAGGAANGPVPTIVAKTPVAAAGADLKPPATGTPGILAAVMAASAAAPSPLMTLLAAAAVSGASAAQLAPILRATVLPPVMGAAGDAYPSIFGALVFLPPVAAATAALQPGNVTILAGVPLSSGSADFKVPLMSAVQAVTAQGTAQAIGPLVRVTALPVLATGTAAAVAGFLRITAASGVASGIATQLVPSARVTVGAPVMGADGQLYIPVGADSTVLAVPVVSADAALQSPTLRLAPLPPVLTATTAEQTPTVRVVSAPNAAGGAGQALPAQIALRVLADVLAASGDLGVPNPQLSVATIPATATGDAKPAAIQLRVSVPLAEADAEAFGVILDFHDNIVVNVPLQTAEGAAYVPMTISRASYAAGLLTLEFSAGMADWAYPAGAPLRQYAAGVETADYAAGEPAEVGD